MENGLSPVSCPVCTLYMREGVTLQSHLNTHPKDQVIAALVRISGGLKESQADAEATCSGHQQEDYAPSGSSHFTTAITYQQYLSSNGSAPQYISMPTILSTPNSAAHSATNQAAFIQMLYNPYVIQQQQQQQFQLLSSVTSPTHPQSYVRHVVPSYPPQPVNIPFQTSETYTADFPTQEFHNSNGIISSSLPLPPSSSSSSTPCPVSTRNTEVNSQSDQDLAIVCAPREQHRDVSTQQDSLPDVRNYETDKTESCSTGVATQTVQYEDEDQKSLKDEDQTVTENEQTEIDQSQCEPVRVRSDLNDVAVSPMNNQETTDQRLDDQYLNSDVSQISGIIMNALRIQSPAVPSSVTSDNEYITCDRPEGKESKLSKEETSEGDKENSGNDENSNRFIDLDSSETVNIIEIDGIHILVPSEFLEKSAAMLETSEEPIKEPETDATSVNIQTDETMPPRGELSEQESVGGNDSSMWVQAFQEKEVSTSYDLLARESWEASDGSDVDVPIETNATEQTRVRQYRVYKCATCGKRFNCPKERRVHQSTFHSDKIAGEEAETSGMQRSGASYKRKIKVKKAVEVDNKPQESQLMGIVLKERAETKLEPDDRTTLGEHQYAETSGNPGVKKEEIIDLPKQVPVKTEFPCNVCDEVFTCSKLRNSHERKLHKKKSKKNVCATCKEMFPSDMEYIAHLQTHPLECSQCGKYFYRRQNLDLHLKRHLGIKPHKCTICDKSFVTKQKLAEHTNSHTGNAPIKCPLCDETFRRYSNLIQHKQRHHLNIKKKIKDFICHCGEIFHSKKKLEWHKEIHEEKPKCCTYCSERFVHSASLTRHIRKAHDCRYVPKCGREVENIECKVCGYIFLKSSMAVHMRMHSGERPYPCHVCGKDFTTKWNLQLHRWIHAARSTKPFKCSLCKSAFFRRSDYTAHMHSHRNVRPYTCNHCGCQFIRKYNCLRHVREHEVNKSFTCNVCGKSFHRSYYLKEHLRVHSGARPFACHICGKASSTKSNHNKHVKIHHAREPVNTEG